MKFGCLVLTAIMMIGMAATAEARSSGSHSGGSHSSGSHSGGSSHNVSGYTRKDGTYVAPYHRTNPNDSKLDNWSTRGNVNPYTGEPGTVDPYRK